MVLKINAADEKSVEVFLSVGLILLCLMEILRRLAHEEGRCVIVVTHDPEVADTADLVLRMKDGVLTAA